MSEQPTRLAPRRTVIDDTRPLWRSLLVFLIPLMLTNIMQSLGSTLNTIYLGRMLGVDALAAVSAIFPIVFFLISFLIGLASASAVLIGQAYGAHDLIRVKSIAGTTLALSALLGVVLAIVGALFTRPILVGMGTPANILPETESYSRIIFFLLPAFFTFLVYSSFLRGTGDAITPFYALILVTACNALFTPALIRGWFGIPPQGINSAAIGQIGATLIGFVAMLVYLGARDHPLAFDARMLRSLRIRWPIAVQLVRIGIPTGLQMVMVSLAEVAVLSFVNRFGSSATAAYGAVNQVVGYVQFPAISIGIAASIFGAQSIGAQRADRLHAIVRSSIALNYLIGGCLIGLAYALSEPLLSLFITDPATLALAHPLLMITLWSYLIFGHTAVLSGIMRSSGTVLWPTVIQFGAIWAVEVPVAWFLSHRVGLDGVWIAYPVAYCCALAMQSAYFLLVWRRRRFVRLV